MKIDVTVNCKCGHNIHATLPCPEPDYFADRNSDSYVESDDYLCCENCGADYELTIMNSFGGADVSANRGTANVHCGAPYFDEDDADEWYWKDDVATHRKTLDDHLDAAAKLLALRNDHGTKFILQVMIYGHLVAAIEGFLSSVFIKTTIDSEELIRRLIETDPKFSEMKFTMSQIFKEREQIKDTVSKHLKEIIFHDLKKIKPMYQTVLGHDFGDIGWLFKAVSKRHHCVHRAGYDKDGNPVSFEDNEIEDLIAKIQALSDGVIEATRRIAIELDDPF
jgi:hypothetical protein